VANKRERTQEKKGLRKLIPREFKTPQAYRSETADFFLESRQTVMSAIPPATLSPEIAKTQRKRTEVLALTPRKQRLHRCVQEETKKNVKYRESNM